MTNAIELVDITKRFGAVTANRAVTLAIARGTIHALVGENGAGKSTLMNILYGACRPDEGEIRLDIRSVRIASPRDAIALGIGMVHQHFMLIEDMDAVDNVMLGAEGGLLLPRARARARATLRRLAETYGLGIDLARPVGTLPIGDRQRIEILKALHRGAEILILDEPTAVLTPQEVDGLFRVLRALKAQGKTIILISHKLREVIAVSDAVTVMRAGEVVATLPMEDASEDRLAELMIGHKPARGEKPTVARGAELLAVDGVTVRDASGRECVNDARFCLYEGEIIGLAGVSGNGQSELIEALAGLRPIAAGSVRLRGHELVEGGSLPSPLALRALGIAHTPEDRQRSGLVATFPAWENSLLGRQADAEFHRGKLLDRDAIVAHCRACMTDLSVRPAEPDLAAGAFSGGNQQKLVLARALSSAPDLLLVAQPSRGVDIGATELIHARLLALRAAGKGVLLLSSDLDEILALADRILVMAGGRIVGEVESHSVDVRRLGLMMAGVAA